MREWHELIKRDRCCFQHSSFNSRSWPASSGWTCCASRRGRWYVTRWSIACTGESHLKGSSSITRYGPGAPRRSSFSCRWRWSSVPRYPWPTSSPLLARTAGSSVSLDPFTGSLPSLGYASRSICHLAYQASVRFILWHRDKHTWFDRNYHPSMINDSIIIMIISEINKIKRISSIRT